MSSVPEKLLTAAEYLARERQAEIKSEFYRGEMFAMSGASRQHNLIAGKIVTALNNLLADRNCEVYPSDMRVKVSPTGLYTYPDVSVACDQPQFEDAETDTLLNPLVIVEVLSKSTEAYDRGPKFEQYRQIQSLQEYLLVAQDRVHVELFQRQPDGSWLLREFSALSDHVELNSVSCQLPLADVYHKVTMDNPEQR